MDHSSVRIKVHNYSFLSNHTEIHDNETVSKPDIINFLPLSDSTDYPKIQWKKNIPLARI